MEDLEFRQLESERLTIGRFRDSDAGTLAAYRDDPDVARYQGWTRPYFHSDAEKFIAGLHSLSPGRPGTWFQFALRLRESDALVGDVALRTTEQDPPEAELGFSLASPHQHHGYAAEAVGLVVDFAFEKLAISRIFSITDHRNLRARRLLEGLDFELTHELESGVCVYGRIPAV